jgi:polar amino acid transport system permease protein
VALFGRDRSATEATSSPNGPSSAPVIRAVKLRHPWRNLIALVIVVYIVAFVYDAFTRTNSTSHSNPYQWNLVGKYLFDPHVTGSAVVTLELTVLSMIIAVVLALLLAVMRLSDNPVLKAIAWGYVWIFRGTPVFVQLTFWGLLASIYPTIGISLPFVPAIAQFETAPVLTFFALSVIGLGLNEAAYLAEIIRAGILSVDPGQNEAATALGMSWTQSTFRIVIPQSMRVIIPPTGNEFIGMLKTTSLVTAVPFAGELFGATSDIANRLYTPIPLLIVASIWYLAITSVFMVGQYFLEKRFARGIGAARGTKVSKRDLATVQLTAGEFGAGSQRFHDNEKDS